MNNLKKRPLVISVIINIFILLCLMIVFRPCYETSDDMYMNEFASGVFGRYEQHLVFINYILGSVIAGLFRIIPFINWYAVIQYVSMFVSFSTIAYVLISKKGNALGMSVSVIVSTVFGYQGYILPQFSKTAGFLILAGALMVFEAFSCGQKVWQKSIIGILLMILGGMFRESMLLLGLLMMFPIGVVEFIREFTQKKISCVGKYILIFFIFVGALVGMKLLYIYHDKQYEKDEAWVEYLEWDTKLVKLIDTFFPYYEDDKELYDELGISEADLRYYEEWNIADVEQLSVETLTKLVEAKEAYWVSTKIKLVNFWTIFPMAFAKISVFPYCILLFIFLLFQSRKRNYWEYTIEIMAFFAAYIYMYMKGRVLFNRIDVVVWLGAILTLLYLWEPTKTGLVQSEKLSRSILMLIQLCCIVLLCTTNGEMLRCNYDSVYAENIYERHEAISKDKAHLYLCTADVLGTAVRCNPFYVGKEGELNNYYVLGSWTVNTPITNQVLENYGVKNPYRDSINNDKVYVIDVKKPELLERYIRENYNENVFLKLSHEIGSYNVYRVLAR